MNAVNGKTFSTKAYPDVDYCEVALRWHGGAGAEGGLRQEPAGYVTESTFKSSF